MARAADVDDYAPQISPSCRLLYASTTEYVLLFGTAVDTSGHSGRYWADISDTLLTGRCVRHVHVNNCDNNMIADGCRFVQWSEGAVESVVHGPGATILHPKWQVTGVQWDRGVSAFLVCSMLSKSPSVLFGADVDARARDRAHTQHDGLRIL